jgi:hypothetical protein
MVMQMIHRLPPILPGVTDQPVAILRQPGGSGNLGSAHLQIAQQRLIRFPDLRQGTEVLFGYYQDMYWCHWVDVVKGQDAFIFVNRPVWNFPRHNFTKQTITQT